MLVTLEYFYFNGLNSQSSPLWSSDITFVVYWFGADVDSMKFRVRLPGRSVEPKKYNSKIVFFQVYDKNYFARHIGDKFASYHIKSLSIFG